MTTANTVTSNGMQIITIGYYTKESADDVASFYKDELEGNGYTQSVQTSADEGIYAAYSENSDGTGRIVVVTASDGDIEGYVLVVLQVSSS